MSKSRQLVPDFYKPIKLKCHDWSVYYVRGFISPSFTNDGRVSNRPKFFNFHTGCADDSSWKDREEWEYDDELKTEEGQMIEKRRVKMFTRSIEKPLRKNIERAKKEALLMGTGAILIKDDGTSEFLPLEKIFKERKEDER